MQEVVFSGTDFAPRKNSCATQIGDNAFLFGGFGEWFLSEILIFNFRNKILTKISPKG